MSTGNGETNRIGGVSLDFKALLRLSRSIDVEPLCGCSTDKVCPLHWKIAVKLEEAIAAERRACAVLCRETDIVGEACCILSLAEAALRIRARGGQG